MRTTATLALAIAAVSEVRTIPAAPVLHPPQVAGPRVTLSWTAVPGATGYRLSVGPAPGTESFAQVVGPVTSVTFNAPLTGTGYVRAQAIDATGLSAPSNEVVVTVTSLTPVPAAPVNLQAFLDGQTVTLSWGAGAGGGPPLGVLIEAGSGPGAANLGAFPLPPTTQVRVPGVAPGTYFVRAYAVNGSGRSVPSNEVRIDMPIGGACSALPAPTLAASASGGNASFVWTSVSGAAGYRLEVAGGPAGPMVFSQAFGAGTTTFGAQNVPTGTYYARVTALTLCGAQTPSSVIVFTVSRPAGGGPRTPDPPPGQRLPLPDMSRVVYAVGNQYRGDLLNSCVEHGGNNRWLFRTIEALRRYDTRWGLNWKRGRVGDMSQDVVTYNFSADPDEGTTNVYIIDVIAGHCGSNPQPAWIDQTEATRQGGTIGRWTLQPYIAAGGVP